MHDAWNYTSGFHFSAAFLLTNHIIPLHGAMLWQSIAWHEFFSINVYWISLWRLISQANLIFDVEISMQGLWPPGGSSFVKAFLCKSYLSDVWFSIHRGFYACRKYSQIITGHLPLNSCTTYSLRQVSVQSWNFFGHAIIKNLWRHLLSGLAILYQNPCQYEELSQFSDCDFISLLEYSLSTSAQSASRPWT